MEVYDNNHILAACIIAAAEGAEGATPGYIAKRAFYIYDEVVDLGKKRSQDPRHVEARLKSYG